jgi:hypothetical protein
MRVPSEKRREKRENPMNYPHDLQGNRWMREIFTRYA